jgi:hypothetical protein
VLQFAAAPPYGEKPVMKAKEALADAHQQLAETHEANEVSTGINVNP